MKTKEQIKKRIEKLYKDFEHFDSEIKRLSGLMHTQKERRVLLAKKTLCAGEFKALHWALKK
jgi:hypothetical protein